MIGELEALRERASHVGGQPEVDGKTAHGMNAHPPETLAAAGGHMVVGEMDVLAGVDNRTEAEEGGSDGPENAADNIGVDAESGVDA